jgi:HAE1 family hydrophobic/amphiphilic exporter-1
MALGKWIFLAALGVALASGARADEIGGEPVDVPDAAAGPDAPGDTDPAADPGPAPSSARPARDAAMIDLSLADAIALAIENNLNVQIARHDPLIAWEDTRIAWGAYDPEAYVEITRSSIETPIASALQSNNRIEDELWDNEGGLRGILPVLSTEYLISFSGDRTKTNRTISSLREQWNSGLTFAITQPLLRDLYWNAPWTEVKLTEEAYGQALEDFRLALMNVVTGVEGAYWGAVAADEQERVAVKSLEASQKLLEQTEVQYEVGVVSKVEVVEAEAGVAERELDLIRARNAYRAAQDRLIDRVFGANLQADSRTLVNPVDRPDDYADYQVDEATAAAKAMQLRPELASLDQAIRQQQILLTFNQNQMAPQIDLVASYGYQGLAGKPCTPDPTAIFPACSDPAAIGRTVDDSFRSSFEDYFDHDGAVNWSVGGVFSIPLGNHAPRARKRQAEIQLRKIRTQRARLVQDIVLDIRGSARDLRSAQEGIEAAERRRLAAEEQFRAESIRLEQGESTPFDVLQRERDLVSAESQKIGAYQLYRDAVAALERSQGTILQRHNVVVDEARELR